MRVDDDERWLFDDDDEGSPGERVIGVMRPASPESVEAVLSADENDDDGRSQFFWLRLSNGDLVLATFPQGETYMKTERDH